MAASQEPDKQPKEDLTASVYAELKGLALARLRFERQGHTLQPTALVHEVCVRLLGGDFRWENRDHLLRSAARCMRHILVDYARSREASKRGKDQPIVSLDDAPTMPAPWRTLSPEEVIDLDNALVRLSKVDERQVLIVELRFFGGLTEDEIAEILGVSSRTVKREWEMARAWLRDQLRRTEHASPADE